MPIYTISHDRKKRSAFRKQMSLRYFSVKCRKSLFLMSPSLRLLSLYGMISKTSPHPFHIWAPSWIPSSFLEWRSLFSLPESFILSALKSIYRSKESQTNRHFIRLKKFCKGRNMRICVDTKRIYEGYIYSLFTVRWDVQEYGTGKINIHPLLLWDHRLRRWWSHVSEGEQVLLFQRSSSIDRPRLCNRWKASSAWLRESVGKWSDYP